MKHILSLILLLFFTFKSFAQTDGITYQAVVIGPTPLELPGVDSESNILPKATVAVRFTIFDSTNTEEFQEVQITETDEFGRINLLIGEANHDEFKRISWDGTSKDLKVEIDFEGGSNFVDLAREQLTFLPFAYHRNITATGTLDVDGNTTLNGELMVELPTNLNSTLTVNGMNATNLSGDLTVDGASNLNSDLNVNNKSITNLSGALNVGAATGAEDIDAPTVLNGTLNVVGKTTVTDFEATGESTFNELIAASLKVTDTTTLLGGNLINGRLAIESATQVRLTSSLTGSDRDITKYPLLVEGGTNGIAITVEGSRTNANNFVSFWDTTTYAGPTTISGEVLAARTPTMWGRIEGEIESEFGNNADYEFDQRALGYDKYDADLDLAWASVDVAVTAADLIAASLDIRPCIGFGVCSTTPGPVDVAFAAAEVILVAVKLGFAIDAQNRADENQTLYDDNKLKFRGVTYASGAGDYAEYLLRADLNESMSFGDVVGVKGGEISKNTAGAEKMMVISRKPIVLGNMPQSNQEGNYEKVAFMGQVPVKVYGKVAIGDYIIPSGKNDGVGIAIKSEQLTTKNVKSIIGIAWERSNKASGFNMINVAVGLNKNDNNPIIEKLEEKLHEQSIEINDLKRLLAETIVRLTKLEDNGVAIADNKPANVKSDNHQEDSQGYDDRKYEIIDTDKGEVIYWEVTREDFEKGLKMAEEQMRLEGFDVDNHLFWKKIKSDSAYKNRTLEMLRAKFDKQVHYHKEIDKKGGH